MTHAAVPLALALAAGPARISPRVALAGMVLAMLPDADVAGFALGIDYAAEWGHRGASQSLAISGILTLTLASLWSEARRMAPMLFLFVALASHGLLDMATSGGLGIALWWPVDDSRLFFPATPIRVSPIGAGFFSWRGVETLVSEALWVWLPCAVVVIAGVTLRRTAPPRDPS